MAKNRMHADIRNAARSLICFLCPVMRSVRNMYGLLLLFGMLALLVGCQDHTKSHDILLGKWKSNEKLTLESMNSVEGVTPKARELFENDFFGDVVIEYRENEVRSLSEKDDYDSGFVPYEVLEVTDKYIRIKSDLLQKYEESNIYLEGDCYYVITSTFNFREYFCRYG